jgi:spore coat polysaccharide biosynthesis protein SpsF
VVQARLTSTRLPRKVLLPLAGAPLLSRVLERVRAIDGVDETVLAIPEGEAQAPLVEFAAQRPEISLFAGSEQDVLSRTLAAAESVEASTVLRVTSDCPMIDPAVSSTVLASFSRLGVSYARTAVVHGYPLGFETEVFTIGALRTAAAEADDPYEREHVTPFIWRRPDRFPAVHLACVPDRRRWRLTVDSPEDYSLACHIYDELSADDPNFGLDALIGLFTRRPELLDINAHVAQNALLDLS